MTASARRCDDCGQLTLPQVLVRFQDVTYPLEVPSGAKMEETMDLFILESFSKRTGWPLSRLCVRSRQLPFVDLRVRSSIRGGKGGFGTLLKGQSRQAGAKLTTDFGACRDLQGRRLRHVNDEIKLRKWREMQKKKESGKVGSKELMEAMYDTPSGLYNWHLMTPTWADISKKATYGIKRQFQKMDREEEKRREAKQQKAQVLQNSITHYAEQATKATQSVQASVSDALRQGLASQQRKRKRDSKSSEVIENVSQDPQPNSLCTLSGEVIVNDDAVADDGKKPSVMQIQSKSEFGTAVLVLDKQIEDKSLYYEVKLVTAGVAQVGWASLLGDRPFEPDNDTGDGVGDDAASYSFDGSRSHKFHAGDEKPYGKLCMAGDIIGCLYDATTGAISYTVNGESMGEAFRTPAKTPLFPALSCNLGEILEIHIRSDEFVHMPDGVTPIHDLLSELTPPGKDDDGPKGKGEAISTDDTNEDETKQSIVEEIKEPLAVNNGNGKPQDQFVSTMSIKPEPLDLSKYSSAEELEALGLDRLKSACMALRIKCGGSLQERASRLWSVQGLERRDFPIRVRAKNFFR